jgi:hypothetical protein
MRAGIRGIDRQLGDEPLRIGRRIPHHDPGDQDMLPAGVGMRCVGHGSVDDLVVSVGQAVRAQPIDDGVSAVVGAGLGSVRIGTQPACSRYRNSVS